MQKYSTKLRPSDCTLSYVPMIPGVDNLLGNSPLCLHRKSLDVHVIIILPPIMIILTLSCSQKEFLFGLVIKFPYKSFCETNHMLTSFWNFQCDTWLNTSVIFLLLISVKLDELERTNSQVLNLQWRLTLKRKVNIQSFCWIAGFSSC